MAYNYVDLFCGAGGLSLGFEREGFKNLFAVEFNPNFAKTYVRNFPKHKLVIDDIKNLPNEKMKKLVGKKEVDIIVGGPPCQGFSKAGNIGRSFLEDERNFLFKEFVRAVECLNPKMFMLENVAAMATHQKGKTIELIHEEFAKAGVGYDVQWKVLNSVSFGVAQERRRIVIVGIRKDLKGCFRYPKESKCVQTVADVIEDLPKLQNGQESEIPNHIAMKHSEQMLKKMSYVKDGGNRMEIPEELRPTSGDIRKYIRYNSKKPSVCVTGDMRKIFHYSQNRALTCRELARIQSFPDSFVFEGSSIQIQQQIGNAVPPMLAQKIAKEVKETLNHVKISKSELHRE